MVPLQFIGLLLGGYLLLRPERVKPDQRALLKLLWAFIAMSAFATYMWNFARPQLQREVLTWADLPYLAEYWLLTAVFVLLFKRAGGSFRQPRVWLDILTMLAVQLVGVWSFFIAPDAVYNSGATISAAATAAYSASLASLLTIATLSCLQLPSYRGRYGLFMLIGAAAIAVASEVSWMSAWLMNIDAIGAFYNYGDVLCFACIISTGVATQFQAPLQSAAINPEKQVFSFLPALAVLLAIACAAGWSLTTQRGDVWILFGLGAVCIQLLLTRQSRMRKELREVNEQLAIRAADVRLTELVRRSSDLLVVIDQEGLISFTSPAIEPMLGVSSTQVQNTRADQLFGAAYAQRINEFLRAARGSQDNAQSIELHLDLFSAGTRDLKLSASDHLHNPAIHGMVLTVHDISGQRAMEREILDAVTRERIRLCADVHDGLGQELTGIALMLQTAALSPDPNADRQRLRLQSLVAHVNHAIGTARDLARGYSPLHVVRGSLATALHRLAQECGPSMPISLALDPALDEQMIGEIAADHLYRIAHEAVTNAHRHSEASQISIGLRRQDDDILLSVADDGKGIEAAWSDYSGLGLRLMSYRAALLGGTLRNTAPAGHGACIEVTVPLRANARAS